MTNPMEPVPDGDYFAVMQAGRDRDSLASRDIYETWEDAADTASAMTGQDCGEGFGYYVVRLEPQYNADRREG